MKRFLAAMLLAAASATGAMGAASTLHAPRDIVTFVLSAAKPTAEIPSTGNRVKALTFGRNDNDEAVVPSIQMLGDNQQPDISEGTIAVMLVHHKGPCQAPQGEEWRPLEKGIVVFVVDSVGENIWEIGYTRGIRSIRQVREANRFGPAEDFNSDPSRYRTYSCGKYQ